MNTSNDDLKHFGVLGMKWGKRKAQIKEYASSKISKRSSDLDKIDRILKSGNIGKDTTDYTRLNYLKKNMPLRVVSSTLRSSIPIIMDLVFINNQNLSSKSYLKIAKEVAPKIAAGVMKDVALAKSTLNRYNDKGDLKKEFRNKLLQREDYIDLAYVTAESFLPLAKYMAGSKIASIKRDRQMNEERVKKWGANLLTDKTQNVIW